MNWHELNGSALRYDVAGSGAPLVLIHELGGSLNSWDECMAVLCERYQVIRLDLRGCGMSEKVQGALQLGDLVADILALLDHLEIQDPVAIAGIAVGGGVAGAFASAHPSRTAAYLGLGPALDAPAGSGHMFEASAQKVEAEGLRAMADGSFTASYPDELRARDWDRYRAVRARWLGNDPRSFAAYYRMFAGFDLVGSVTSLQIPVAIFGAMHDSRFTPEIMKEFAEATPHAYFEALDTGHLFAAQSPDIVADAIIRFLEKIEFK